MENKGKLILTEIYRLNLNYNSNKWLINILFIILPAWSFELGSVVSHSSRRLISWVILVLSASDGRNQKVVFYSKKLERDFIL